MMLEHASMMGRPVGKARRRQQIVQPAPRSHNWYQFSAVGPAEAAVQRAVGSDAKARALLERSIEAAQHDLSPMGYRP